MAMDVYDQLAAAAQAAMAEKESDDNARAAKIHAALIRSGHMADWERLIALMSEPHRRVAPHK